MAFAEEIANNYFATTGARSYTQSRAHYDEAARQLVRGLGAFLPPANQSVDCLDIGCGTGELLYLLHSRGARSLRGVDLCQDELDRAGQFVSAELVCESVHSYLAKLPSDSLDHIFALNILEHLDKGMLSDVLTSARRVLRSGGSLVAMVPNALSPFGASTRYWDITHQLAFTPNSLRQLAVHAGYSPDMDFREWGPRVHGVKSLIRSALWRALRGGIAAWFLIETGSTRGEVYTMDMLARFWKKSS